MNRMRVALRRDDGLGLTEVVIAMLLLMIVMMAMLSLIITSFRALAKNSTQATATELVTARIEYLQTVAVQGLCTNFVTEGQKTETFTDGRGVELTVSGTVTNCEQVGDPKLDPKLARVTVSVTSDQPGLPDPLVERSTTIYVRFAPS